MVVREQQIMGNRYVLIGWSKLNCSKHGWSNGETPYPRGMWAAFEDKEQGTKKTICMYVYVCTYVCIWMDSSSGTDDLVKMVSFKPELRLINLYHADRPSILQQIIEENII